jgi:pyruvate dehydrogenase E2 component (dihydrolipoamide acetyltransferase)
MACTPRPGGRQPIARPLHGRRPQHYSAPGAGGTFNTLQQAVVRNMTASLAVPTFHVGYTITTDNLDALYKQIKSKGVTMTALLAKAVAVALQRIPMLNACLYRPGHSISGWH